MILTITGIQRKEMPSQWDKPWYITKVKTAETGDTVFELSGYNDKYTASLQVGHKITGYKSKRAWKGKDGNDNVVDTFCKITAEYVYAELLKLTAQKENKAIHLTTESSIDEDEWKSIEEKEPAF